MQPFNLDAALKGAKVITRDGRPVMLGVVNHDAESDSVVSGWVSGVCRSWTVEGNYYNVAASEFDLFMAPSKRDGWINVCSSDVRLPGSTIVVSGRVYPTEKEAMFVRSSDKVKTIYIEWEE